MSSSFLILYPDVPQKALVITANKKFADNYGLRNAFSGYYRNYARLHSPSDDLSITFDLGTGNTRQVDYFLIGGVSQLKTAGITKAVLQGSSDGTVWVDQLGTTAGFQSLLFDGPNDDDVIFTSTYNDDQDAVLAPYRYFRVVFETPEPPTCLAFKRLYFGTALDMQREPSTYEVKLTTEREADTWVYPRGHTIMSKAFYPKHTFNLTFEGVSDTKTIEVSDKLLDDPYRSTVYLYTETYRDPLYNNGLVLCKVPPANLRISKRNNVLNWNDISVSFEEI